MKKSAFISLISLISLISSITPFPAYAQTMRSSDFSLEIKNIELSTSTENSESAKSPKEFTKQGYIISELPQDTAISTPFTITPGAYLVRAKPGAEFSLPITAHNFKDSAVLQAEIIPFMQTQSGQKTSLDWISIDNNSFLIEKGKKQKINLKTKISENANQGDYYIKVLLSNYKQKYLFASSEIYFTITKTGVIFQNISYADLKISRFILNKKDNFASILIANGSPFFDIAEPSIIIKSPIGFSKTLNTSAVILTANQTKEIFFQLENLPIGPTKIIVNNQKNLSRWIFVIPSL